MSQAPAQPYSDLASAPLGPPPTEDQRLLVRDVAERIGRGEPHAAVLDFLVAELKRRFPTYAWTGVYLAEGDVLVLGPFRGLESPHHRIRVGDEGICGWVARYGIPQVVPDVSADPRYLMCSSAIRSEIVVPLRRSDRILGVIDIDSELPAAFTATDLALLTELAELVAPTLPEPAPAAERS